MKKLLLGTSALIGATAIVASASAAPELTISGSLDFRLIGGDQSALGLDADGIDARNAPDADNEVGVNNSGFEFSRGVDSRSEIRFLASAESDAGTRYGADIQYRYQAGSTDESYVFVADDWGRVHLGNDDGVADGVPYWGSVSAGAYMIDGWETSIGRHAFGTSDGTKVSYFSNDFNGFNFGATLGNGQGGTFDTVYEFRASYAGEAYGVGFSIGAGLKAGSAADQNSIPQPEVAAAVTGRQVNIETGVAQDLAVGADPAPGHRVEKAAVAAVGNDPDLAVTKADAQIEDLEEYIVGATVSFGSVSIGLGYTDAGESGLRADHVRGGAEARTATGASIAYDLGGGMAISLGFVEAESTDGDEVETTNSITALDFGFPIMDGMVGYAGIATTETEIGTGPDNSADATTYLVGTTVSF